jgi:hypothetical protein
MYTFLLSLILYHQSANMATPRTLKMEGNIYVDYVIVIMPVPVAARSEA